MAHSLSCQSADGPVVFDGYTGGEASRLPLNGAAAGKRDYGLCARDRNSWDCISNRRLKVR